MGDEKVTDTIFGRCSKFEVVKIEPLLFGGSKYVIRRDGEALPGIFSDRRRAVITANADAQFG